MSKLMKTAVAILAVATLILATNNKANAQRFRIAGGGVGIGPGGLRVGGAGIGLGGVRIGGGGVRIGGGGVRIGGRGVGLGGFRQPGFRRLNPVGPRIRFR